MFLPTNRFIRISLALLFVVVTAGLGVFLVSQMHSPSPVHAQIAAYYHVERTSGDDIDNISGGIYSVLTQRVTMPSSGCPCRAFVQYSVNFATNNWTANAMVDDGNSTHEVIAQGQTMGPGANYTGIQASEISQYTYSNNQTVTFELLGIISGSGGKITARPEYFSQYPGENTFLTIGILENN